MDTTIEREVAHLAKSVSNDPLIVTLIRRGIASIINNVKDVNGEEVSSLLSLQDVDFSMKLGNTIAERQMLQTHNNAINANFEKNKMVQKFLNSLEAHGGGYTSIQLAEAQGVSKQAISNRKSRDQLFHVTVGGQTYYPAFQFSDDSKIASAFKSMITTLAKKDRIASFFFLIQQVQDGSENFKPIYDILRGEKQPRYIYDQIDKKAKAIHAMAERK
ncbi:MAG: hypothetical protein MJK04_35395 [Psychrosphaera sp.]|nr:hypothetical protein [Psychrosphaera sp.]